MPHPTSNTIEPSTYGAEFKHSVAVFDNRREPAREVKKLKKR
jgi:hypothetical protein